MKSIKDFFARIQTKQGKEIHLRLTVQESVEKHTGIHVLIENFSFQIKKVTIKGLTSAARSAVFIKKGAILKDLAEKLPERGFTDLQ